MEAEQIRELRRWAEQLKSTEDAEKRAAGRAILMLLDELERGRGRRPPPAPAPSSSPDPPAAPAPQTEEHESRYPDPLAEERSRRQETRKRKRRWGWLRLATALSVLGGIVYGGLAVGAVLAAPELDAAGPQQDARIGPAGLPTLTFSVRAGLDNVKWTLDGEDVTVRTRLRKGRIVFTGARLSDGEHTLKASSPGSFPGSRSTKTWRFVVDTTGPEIVLDRPAGRIPAGEPLRLSGKVEPDALLTVDGETVPVRDGKFAVTWKERPREPVLLTATDTLRNTATKQVEISFVPRRPPRPVRAVHVTFSGWGNDELRNGVMQLIRDGRINAVELDLKDEGGIVGWDADVPFARKIGAVREIYDLEAAVKELHALGIRVIGRLVCFRDPVHANAAWGAGRRAEVVQTPGGGMYASDYGGFTNFANAAVRKYQIDVAVAAAKLGVDEILYDYVRRPDGPRSTMTFPGLKKSDEEAIASFLADTRRALKPYGTFLGASVFGIAATRPEEIAQDIPSMAEHLDYVSAMVYPSHWGPGEYGVASPNAQPYDIVLRSLQDFVVQVRGTGARVVPWLQDFTLGVDYGPEEVAAQIKATRDAGIDEWLLWDPLVTYTADALTTDAKEARFRRQALEAGTTALQPNELGLVPVLMHHQIRADGGGPYDLTPQEFRDELDRLYRNGYVPVRAIDLVTANLNVPLGRTPVVMTFDDSTKEQFLLDEDGTPKEDTAIAIMLEFQREHPDWKMAGSFYPNRDPFAGVEEGPEMLRWLAANGFELGNHTKDHLPLNTLDDVNVQRQLIEGVRLITAAVPNARVRTLALPLGAMPANAALAVSGSWDGQTYRHDGVFLAGAEPSPSPYAMRFDPTEIPRIRTTHYSQWRGERDFTAGYWFDVLEKEPGLRYVSDGNPNTITIPGVLLDKLKPQYRSRAKTY